jgi:hypothetical protein
MSGRDNSRNRQAVRRAREARATRVETLAVREKAIEAALVDFFRALGEVERIKEQAKAKADALLAEAAHAAETPWTAACAAVQRLRELLGNNAQVAELTGLKQEDVRRMLAATKASEEPQADAGETGQPGEFGAIPQAPAELPRDPAAGETPSAGQ